MEHPSPFKEALLYETSSDGSVSCGVCERKCRILIGERGFCGSRQNVDGRLYAFTYGELAFVTNNPIEKKPLFHYWPGSRALSAGGRGCNLKCVYCQNHALSMASVNQEKARYTSPEALVALAAKSGSAGLSFTFNEASCTLLEYVLDCFRLAGTRRLYRNLNTNGYMTHEALSLLIEAGLDSLCFDIKGDETFYRRFCSGTDPEPVWRNAAEAKRRGLHVEMVNLVVPGGNDGRRCVEEVITRTRDELGRNTPLHFTRFYPAYRAREHGLNRITTVETLEDVRSRALEEGLNYVYIGNVQGHDGENTYCPRCMKLLIYRYGFKIIGYTITGDGLCPECGTEVPIVGKPKLERGNS